MEIPNTFFTGIKWKTSQSIANNEDFNLKIIFMIATGTGVNWSILDVMMGLRSDLVFGRCYVSITFSQTYLEWCIYGNFW